MTKKEWKQTERLYNCTSNSAWEQGLFYSNMYPPNMSVKWLDTDTPEAAQYEKDITYEFNGHGFRSDDFTEKSDINILTCGCSLTVGVGVDQHEIWPYRLKKLIEAETGKSVTVWNLATSGASGDYVARSLWKVRSELQSDFVFVYWPPDTRLELLKNKHEQLLTQVFIEDANFPKLASNLSYLTANKNKNQILAQLISIKKIAELSNVHISATARDNMHPDPKWHTDVANQFLAKYLTHNEKDRSIRYNHYMRLKGEFKDK